MANVPLFSIPGNIKQQFLPFVLDPKSFLNRATDDNGSYIGSSSWFNGKNDITPQLFSYKNTWASISKSGFGKLNFYPSSMNSILINDDISYQLLYNYEKNEGGLKIQDILNHIPAVQIREFLPDTRLDQCINFFTDLFQSMTSVVTKKEDSSTESKSQSEEAGFFKKLMECTNFVIQYMVGLSDPNLYSDLSLTNNIEFPFSSYEKTIWKDAKLFGSPKHSPGFYVMTFPYTLYYRLQSCLTTNIYEIPGATEPRRIASSEGGMSGWTDGGSDLMSAGGFRVTDALSKIPLIGNIANMILGNIGINYMPWWNADAGSKTKEPQVDIKFDLFNDSAEAAMKNFIFVNTIVPNNKWIQYNMFQHSPCIYDVKLEGINRLYACAGSFNVTYEGTLRDPPKAWIDVLVEKHANKNIVKEQFINNIKNFKIIKIPDVYRVEMHFQSLLPSNFNNFIFNYAENSNMSTRIQQVYDPTLGSVFGQALGKFGAKVAEVWDKGNAKAANVTLKTFDKDTK